MKYMARIRRNCVYREKGEVKRIKQLKGRDEISHNLLIAVCKNQYFQ